MRYIFADCVLDTALVTLYRAGRPVPLRPKVFHLLQYLLEQRAHLVGKDVLCAQVWPGQFISDATLEGCIKEARQAIGDSGQEQRLIQTRRGYGYRFVGPVEVQPAGHPERTDAVLGGALAPPAVSSPEPAPGREDRALPGGEPGVSLWGVQEAAPMRLTPRAADGERKLVTLLGCALVHAPTLGNQRGLDALHSQMRALYALARSEVHQYGGTLQHVTGDRFMALFGVPAAQEDHAWRAVLAALGLLRRVAVPPATLGVPAGAALAVRMGLHTGLVAVGGIGDEAAVVDVVGDTATLATALQEHAAPGTILCSATTARLVQAVVEMEAVGPVPAGEQGAPVMAYKVLGGRPAWAPAAPHEARTWNRFVGRGRELETLLALLARVEDGLGHVVGLMGDPGIGKSRLLDAFRQRLTGRRLTYLRGRCLSYGSTTPYLPVLDLLRYYCDITETDTPEAMMAKVYWGLREVGMVPEEWAPYFLQLLGLEPGAEPLAQFSPQEIKARTFEALVQLSILSSRQRPLVLEVEDLHWIDATSEEWLAALVEHVVGVPILLLVSYRPGYQTRWMDKSYTTQLTLRPLTPSDSRQVLQAVLHTEPVSETLVQTILAKADGNPFFLEELAQMVVEQGEQALSLGIPDTVQAVLAARIDRLPPVEKHILQIAAVIGTEVPVPLLHAVAELPEEALHHGLAHLQATEFLYETSLASEDVYTFKHALTHEVAYSSLLLSRRRALHTRIVEALEVLAGDRVAEAASEAKGFPAGRQGLDQVELLAYHALRGEVWAKALTYCQQAGEKALVRSAHREAVEYFEQAVSVLAHLPETRDTCAQAIDLRLELRNALWTLGELERLFTNLQEAEVLAEALGDQHRLGWVSVYLLAHFAQTCDPDRALASGQRALEIATALEDIGLTVVAQHYLGGVYRSLGDYRRAVECFQKNVACLHSALLQERLGLPGLASVFARSHLVVSLAECGAFAEGQAPAEEGVQFAEAADHPYSRVMALWAVGLRALRQGDLAQALPVLERAFDLVQMAHLRLLVPMIAAPLGAVYTLAGRVTEALALLEQAVAQAVAMHYMWDHALRVVWLSEAYLLAGRLDKACAQARQALEFSRAHQERGHAAYALRLLGEIAAWRDPAKHTQAVVYYQQALTLADELGMRPLQAHCYHSLGTLYTTIGQPEQARVALSTAIALYRAMEMAYWLSQAEAALAQVEAQS
jgi:class 3 adenylate cyclase/DNA-binding winged helix-turn-helix (wHTH) protein/tetratricopeptide (TPR) repeat protein